TRIRRPSSTTLFPYTTLFRSREGDRAGWRAPGLRPGLPAGPVGGAIWQPPLLADLRGRPEARPGGEPPVRRLARQPADRRRLALDRKSTRLNSSHRTISYAVF